MIGQAIFSLASPGAARARLSVLIFHRVRPVPDGLFPGEPDAASFEAMIMHVRTRFRVLPLNAALAALKSGTLPARALSITFDDGYADNLTVAEPILRRHGVTATVFVATGFLDGKYMWNDVVIESIRAARGDSIDLGRIGLGRCSIATLEQRRAAIDEILSSIKYLPAAAREQSANEVARIARAALPGGIMLTPDGVRDLEKAGIGIGAHTVTHPILSSTTPDDAWHEITTGKRELEAIADKEVTLFAYPNGRPKRDFERLHIEMVRKAGFQAAVTTAPGAARSCTDAFEIPRFTPWSRSPLKFDLLMLRNLKTVPTTSAS